MKIERQEKSMRLIPENNWEIEALKELKNHGIEKMQFQDDWNSTGYLQLNYTTHPWDK